MTSPVTIDNLPKHVAIIMDGNGRWAERHRLSRSIGHQKGANSARRLIELFIEYKIPFLTLYIFSTENWSRPEDEVSGILKLLEENLERGLKYALNKDIKIRHLGRLDRLSPQMQKQIINAQELTKNNNKLTVGLAFNYGSRDELIDVMQKIIQNGVNVQSINETVVNKYLYTSDIPDPDLIIRTGGEKRLSNFLLWQAAYSEIYFTSTLWPDFNKREFDKALIAYSKRERRFGGLSTEQKYEEKLA